MVAHELAPANDTSAHALRARAWVSGRGRVAPPLPASRTALTIRGLEIQVEWNCRAQNSPTACQR